VPPPHVFVVTDAAVVYGTTVEMARAYRFGEIIPPLLVVGMGQR
jgi:hypothetical protein